MYKYFNFCILALIVTLLPSIVEAQTWPKIYGESDRYEFGNDIQESYDMGYYILGNYLSPNYVQKATWLIKTNVNGEILWEKVFSNSSYNKSFALEQTSIGGIIACGGIRRAGNTKSEPYVVKLNSCGEKEWCKVFAESPNTYPVAIDIKELSTGNLILLVNMYGENPHETMHLFKLNTYGEVLWKEPFCSAYNHPMGSQPLGNSLFITSDQKYLITGSVYWKNPWEPTSTTYYIRPLFVMADSMGIEEWVLPYGINDTLFGTAKTTIETNENGIFISTGSDWASSNFIQPLFMKFDENGNENSYNSIAPDYFDENIVEGAFTEILQIDSSYFVQGLFEFQPGDIYKTCTFNIDTGLFSYEIQINNSIYIEDYGNYNLEKTIDDKILHLSTYNEFTDQQIRFSKLNLSLEYDTAYVDLYNYDSLCIPGPPQSGFISLDTCDIITGIEIPSPAEYYSHLKTIPVTAYPNPANGKVKFSLENTIHHQNISLKCYSLMGKQFYETIIITGQKEALVNIKDWLPGLYIAVVYSDNVPVGQCKFVVN